MGEKNKNTFTKRVYDIVKKIPKGRAVTYKEVAQTAGSPRAWRAVGNILKKNKNPILPCYRVIRSNGKIGGYKWGKKKKMNLLKKEGLKLKI
ncbi:MAG: hypothetical protein CO034_02425 [Parcubacteria group bacterium CG_4_9_14_0_2_um_filter_35_11]|nr:MAG: hypothetical protein COS98_01920 [Parcubacteria group bacterium CG07_land_8_20_14_0_80_35_11]PJC47477.1 MAG: hypothetical protein CO034_02425 [Parcubacteria group bacterium CG_4_9_14_0_2_um_filter_35_11]